MAKNVTFTMSEKDAKTIMAAAEILKNAFTAPVATPTATPKAAPTKKAVAKKAAPKKATTKNRSANMAMITSRNRMVITANTLDRVNLFGRRVQLLQNTNKNELLMTAAGAKVPAHYKVVKTISLPYGEAEIGVKRYLGDVYQGQKIHVSFTGNTIKFTK